MNTMIVWVVIAMAVNGNVVYSPPVADLASCERMQVASKELTELVTNYPRPTKCVQINMVFLAKEPK